MPLNDNILHNIRHICGVLGEGRREVALLFLGGVLCVGVDRLLNSRLIIKKCATITCSALSERSEAQDCVRVV